MSFSNTVRIDHVVLSCRRSPCTEQPPLPTTALLRTYSCFSGDVVRSSQRHQRPSTEHRDFCSLARSLWCSLQQLDRRTLSPATVFTLIDSVELQRNSIRHDIRYVQSVLNVRIHAPCDRLMNISALLRQFQFCLPRSSRRASTRWRRLYPVIHSQ
jgi:hypothetical protein